MTDFSVTLVHALPGRLRLRLSHAPGDIKRFLDAIRAHDGLEKVAYTPVTRGVLITYRTGHLTAEELLLRTAMAFSMVQGDVPVVAFQDPESEVMTDLAIVSGLLVVVASLARFLAWSSPNAVLEKTAGLGVALAVLQHGVRETREKGMFDPELITLGYLIAAFAKKRSLRGAVVTWAASFGRHVLRESARGVEVRPMAGARAPEGARPFQVSVAPLQSKHAPLVASAQTILRSLGLVLDDVGGNTLFKGLRSVALTHGEVMEGLDRAHRHGIPLVFS
ncbi:MAG: hypothetical protein QNJ97_27865 [Myxococcota bacterium]|nr:hypothetical protein [Myxococcota bacterium]